MILLLFIICIVNLITFYNVDYKYYNSSLNFPGPKRPWQ